MSNMDLSISPPQSKHSYTGVLVSLSVKAVHLEVVPDLSGDGFIASLRRFTARRGKPTLI